MADAKEKTGAEQESAEVTKKRARAKTREGLVVSSNMDKTVVVAVNRLIKHAFYHKYIKRTKKYFAHDEENACRTGDLVRIVETRPLSKRKRWRIKEVLVAAK